MFESFLVPEKTIITAKGDGEAVDISGAQHQVFLVLLEITEIVEQESLDLSVFGSADGTTWTPKPIATFPQKFYRGQSPILVDLREQPEIKFLRAHWDVNRWGRGPETPTFEIKVKISEVAPELLRQPGQR